MGYLNICGFETGDGTEAFSTFGTNSIQTGTVRSGTYSLQINPAGGSQGGAVFRGHAADATSADYSVATAYHRFYFRYATAPSTNDEPIFTAQDSGGNNVKLEVRLNSAGNLAAYGANLGTALLATGTTVLSANTWYRIEVKVGTGNPAAWEVQINGVSEISGSSNVGTNNNARCVFGMSPSRNSNAVNFFYDDIAIRDDQYPGAGQVTYLKPNANGTDAGWTTGTNASDYTQVNETTPDNDTTYIATSSVGPVKNEVKLTSTSSSGITGTVTFNCVKALAVVRNASGAQNFMEMYNLSGATSDITTAVDPGSTYVPFAKMYATDPNTSAAWTRAGVDAFQPGVNKTQATPAREQRCTYLSVMVDWVAGAAGPATTAACDEGGVIYRTITNW